HGSGDNTLSLTTYGLVKARSDDFGDGGTTAEQHGISFPVPPSFRSNAFGDNTMLTGIFSDRKSIVAPPNFDLSSLDRSPLIFSVS
ncbi:hypothetical protein A2U01_0083882, partial [Trifolium medium]|nr:hypothetical protein [Trifolium medium]